MNSFAQEVVRLVEAAGGRWRSAEGRLRCAEIRLREQAEEMRQMSPEWFSSALDEIEKRMETFESRYAEDMQAIQRLLPVMWKPEHTERNEEKERSDGSEGTA